MPLISIIVPIYNSALYLERCVVSLMEQTLCENIEFIFIDDASSDDSYQVLQTILARYPARNPQIHILRNTINKGIAYVRTQGILASTGNYIGWCDSDDWVEPQMFHNMIACAQSENADIVVCAFTHEHENHTVFCDITYPATGQEYLQTLYRRITSICFLWNKIFRRSIFTDYGLFPFPGINISEDMNLAYRAFFYADKVRCLHQFLYHHDNTEHPSLSHHRNDIRIREQNFLNDQLICDFLLGKDPIRFRRSCHFIKFMSKVPAECTFLHKREYFEVFKECHRDIIHFSAFPLNVRIKWVLIYSCYPCYRLYCWYKN